MCNHSSEYHLGDTDNRLEGYFESGRCFFVVQGTGEEHTCVFVFLHFHVVWLGAGVRSSQSRLLYYLDLTSAASVGGSLPAGSVAKRGNCQRGKCQRGSFNGSPYLGTPTSTLLESGLESLDPSVSGPQSSC